MPSSELWLEDIVAKAPVPPTVVAAMVAAMAERLGPDGRTVRATRFILEGRQCLVMLGEAPANMPPISAGDALGQVTFELLTGVRWLKGQADYSKESLLRQVSGQPAAEAVADLCHGLLTGAITVAAAKTRADALATLYRVDLRRRLEEAAAGQRNLRVDQPEQMTGAFPAGFLRAGSSLPPEAPEIVDTPLPAGPRAGVAPTTAIMLIMAFGVAFAVLIFGGLAVAWVVSSW